jgi:hypothetical protein
MSAALGAIPQRPVWASPVLPWEFCDRDRQSALRAAWNDGEISHQLTPSQIETYDKIRAWEELPYAQRAREYVLDSSRRWGKSELGCVWLIENCLRSPKRRYLYIGPERKQIEDLVLPIMARILSECPPELRPTYHQSKRVYTFPNGSTIELYGLDKNPNASRGGAIDGAFLDEAGFFKRLRYLLRSVLTPQMLGRIWASLLLASTPPDTPSHYWSTDVVKSAIARRAYDRRTIEDADQYPIEEIESMIEAAGGRADPTCRREYFAEHIADAEKVCVPEYVAVAREIVRAVDPPAWRHCYTTLDPGWHDLVAALFGYWHFELAKLVIEDEIAEVKMNSARLASAIKAKETELWKGLRCRGIDGEITAQPYQRYSDRDPRLLGDLREIHDLPFERAQKDPPEQAVNQLRVALSTDRIWIHPRCVQLQAHLKSAVWKDSKDGQHKAFAWQGGIFGHFDLLAALLYLWRNVDRYTNPAPPEEQHASPDVHRPLLEPERGPSRWMRDRPQLPMGQGQGQGQWAVKGGRMVRTR